MKKHRKLLAAGLVLLLFAACFAWTGDYYHADAAAEAALLSDEEVTVTQTGFGWFFDGPSERCALVFYPGAKVEAEAYAPLLHRLAAQGVDAFLLEVPLRLAFLAPDRADEVLSQYDYEHWFVGGHSLGGAMAANYAASHGDELEGLVLLAAYATKELPEDLTEILIVGSEDGVVQRGRIETGRSYAPERYVEQLIEGGSHAQFGNYGLQAGDGTPTLSAEEQQAQTVAIITANLVPG